MFKTLNCFLQNASSIDDVIFYDFKDEAPWKDVIAASDPLKKFLKYKEHNKNGESFDCDSCCLAKDIYKKIWGWNNEGDYRLNNELQTHFNTYWHSFGADTMNSVQTTLTQAKVLYQEQPHLLYKNKYFTEYVSLTHTVGNFTLVPYKLLSKDDYSFNQYRGNSRLGKYFVKDFFDLSLKIIKENTDAITFKRYIDTFFLNDYVDEKYNILPLFSRHKNFLKQHKLDLENPDKFLPLTIDELNEYLVNSTKRIKARGKRIACALSNDLNEKSTQPVWVNNLIKGCVAIGGATLALFLVTLFVLMTSGFRNAGGFQSLVQTHGFFSVTTEGIVVFFGPALKTTLSIAIIGALLLFILKKLFQKFAKKVLKQCPHCKKMFGLKKTGSKIRKKEDIQILVELKDKGPTGEVIGTREEYIPGERHFIDINYTCKRCGHRTIQSITKDYKKI